MTFVSCNKQSYPHYSDYEITAQFPSTWEIEKNRWVTSADTKKGLKTLRFFFCLKRKMSVCNRMKLGDWAVSLIHHPLNVNLNDLSKILFSVDNWS